MADITVCRLEEKLKELKIEVPDLLATLKEAGLDKKDKDDSLTTDESKSFIAFLIKKGAGSETKSKPKTLSLKGKRKANEELVTDSAGRKHKVTVIRRKERVVQKTGSLLGDISVLEVKEQDVVPEAQELLSSSVNIDMAINEPEIINELADDVIASEVPKLLDVAASTEDLKAQEDAKEKDKEKKKIKKKPEALVKEQEEPVKSKKIAQQEQEKHWNRTKVFEELANADDDLEGIVVVAEKIKAKEYVKKVQKKIVIKDIKPSHGFNIPSKPVIHEVSIPDEISVADLAQKMALKAGKVIRTLMQMGIMATINQVLDRETAILVVEELGHKPKLVKENALEEDLKERYESEIASATPLPRAPVVTIMGHVDHGKTSLLDYIRRTKVTAEEAGGITQHIGAYSVNTANGKITFLDTPGHAAFSAMRARGATVTDVVVLVVSADDGVMPQTIEAIQHSKAAKVPIVVAINKIDKPEADPERIKIELSHHEVISESWGGEHQFVEVSAKTGQGIDNLLESILLQTEILELKAPRDIVAQGVVIESRLDKGRGVVATLLVRNGTLRKGDIILAGTEYGRVRGMIDAAGHKLDEAYPSDPVEISGLSAPPKAGDEFMVVQTEREAREVALYRQFNIRLGQQAKQRSKSVEDLFSRSKDSDVSILNIILKADVQGSVEAIATSLEKISTDEVKVNMVGSGVGGINESDVTLAMASKAIIIGFNVRADQGGRKLAEAEGVKIIYDSIIYNVIDDIKQILSGMLSPEIREEIIGLAQVRDVFRSSKLGAVAGCMVIEGSVKRNNPIRVLRDNVVIYEGELESLRRFKDDVNEVKQGIECGIGVKNYNDVKVGDQIEVFQRTEVKRTLN